MAGLNDIVSDPAFQALSAADQLHVRQKFYDKVSADPEFRRLADSDREAIREKILGAPGATPAAPAADPAPKTITDYLADAGSAALEGVKAAPGAIVELAKEVGKAAVTQPTEGLFDIAGAPRRVGDLLKGVASGATAGIYRPEAEDEAAAARQQLGGLAGFALPFTAVAKGARALGAGKVVSELLAGGLTGAAAPAVEGDIKGAVTGGVAGAGLVGGFQAASKLFHRFYGRAPKSKSEVRAAVERDPQFERQLAEFPKQESLAKEISRQDAPGRTIGEQPLPDVSPVSKTLPAKAEPTKPAALGDVVKENPAAKQYLEQFIQPAAEVKRVELLQHDAARRAVRQAESYAEGGNMGRGIESLLARDIREKAGFSNVEYRAKSIYDKARARAADAYEALAVRRLGLSSDDALAEKIGRAMFGEKADPAAAKLAGELSSSMDALRLRGNVGGMNIPRRKNFGLPQVHDVNRIAASSIDEWVNFTAPKVRRIYAESGDVLTMPEQIRSYLGKTYEKALSDAAALRSGTPGEIKLQAESRRIIFKDYDNWRAYSERFGHGDAGVLNIVDSHLRELARETALIEILGPRPRETLDALIARAKERGQLTKPQERRIERLFNVVSGAVDGVESQKLANAGAFIRSWLVSAQLGSAPISALSDTVTGAMARKANGMPVTRGIKNLFTGLSRPEAARLGIAADHSLLQLKADRFGEFAGAAGGAGKGADFVLRASGLTKWTEAGRKAFGVEFLNFLGEHVKNKTRFGELPSALQTQLPKYGITPGQWDNIVLKAKTIDKHGASFLDLDSFGSLVKDLDVGKPFREAAATIEGAEKLVTGQQPRAAVNRRLMLEHRNAGDISRRIEIIRDTENHLREMLATESEFAMISGSDARVKSLTTFGAERGSFMGELARNGLLYRSFPLSILYTHLARGLQRPTVAGKLGYVVPVVAVRSLGPFIAGSTAIGALSIQSREIAKGRTPRDMSQPQFWIDALQQGGGLSVFEALLETEGGFDRTVTQLLGPVGNLARDVYNLTADNALTALKNELTPLKKKDLHLGRDVARFIERYTPGGNLWQSRLLVDRLVFDNLQRALDPEAEESFRAQARAPRRWGGEYYWAPGELVPGGPVVEDDRPRRSLADFGIEKPRRLAAPRQRSR